MVFHNSIVQYNKTETAIRTFTCNKMMKQKTRVEQIFENPSKIRRAMETCSTLRSITSRKTSHICQFSKNSSFWKQ